MIVFLLPVIQHFYYDHAAKKALLVESQFKGVIVLTGLMFVTWSISK